MGMDGEILPSVVASLLLEACSLVPGLFSYVFEAAFPFLGLYHPSVHPLTDFWDSFFGSDHAHGNVCI